MFVREQVADLPSYFAVYSSLISCFYAVRETLSYLGEISLPQKTEQSAFCRRCSYTTPNRTMLTLDDIVFSAYCLTPLIHSMDSMFAHRSIYTDYRDLYDDV